MPRALTEEEQVDFDNARCAADMALGQMFDALLTIACYDPDKAYEILTNATKELAHAVNEGLGETRV